MADEAILMVAVEPPLNVGNSLMEACRRLSGDAGARGLRLTWVPPDLYAVPVVTLAPDNPEARLFAMHRIQAVTRAQEEIPVQLMPLTVEEGPDQTWQVMARLTAQGSAIEDLGTRLVQEFSDTALVVTPILPVGIRVASVTSEPVAAALREMLPEGRNVPIAGWLLGGVHLMAATWRPEERQYDLSRLRQHPFRRLGSKPA